MTYSDNDLTRLKKKVSLLEIAAARLSLKKSGKDYVALCPFHSENTPSFTIFTGKDKVDLYKCHGCGATGNIFNFLERFDNVTFEEAVEKVATIAGWEKGKREVNKTFKQVIDKEEPKLTFPISAMVPAERELASNSGAREWLAHRGISLDTAERLHIGYIQSAAAINENNPFVGNGWIVFPYTVENTIKLLKYRSIVSKKDGILRKSGMETLMYNIDSINPIEDAFVVEGEPDTLIMEQAGYRTAGLPSAGYSPTPEERDRLISANNIYLAGDMDKPGRDTMTKLWAELRDHTYLIEWPTGCKDANDCFLKVCNGDVEAFKNKIEELKQIARQKPIPNFYNMNEVLKTADDTNPMEDPKRLHFPWIDVDRMAICRPGSVVSSFATYTGSGKTTFWLAVELEEAIKHDSVVLNYSAELSPQELATLTTAILTQKNRLKLTREDYDRAARIMKDSKFYVGYNPDISTIQGVLGDGTEKNPGVLEWAIRRLGANIVVLDHLHFFTSGDDKATTSEAFAMTRIKNLAVKYGVIFIVVGQSRKANQNNKHKVSESSDAKGSEAFVSTANTTYHIHRDMRSDIDPVNPPSDLLDPVTSIRLYKCRTKGDGKSYTQLYFMGSTGRFVELIPDKDNKENE